MLRRQVIRATLFLPIGLVVGCNGLTAAQVSAQVASDVSLIASGLAGALPGLASLGVISAEVVAKVGQYVGQLQQLASGVSTALSQTAAAPIVQQIGAVLSQIVAVAGPLLPPPWGTAIMAAQVLWPLIAAGVGLLTSNAPQAAAMTPDTARLTLAGLAAK